MNAAGINLENVLLSRKTSRKRLTFIAFGVINGIPKNKEA